MQAAKPALEETKGALHHVASGFVRHVVASLTCSGGVGVWRHNEWA